MQQRYQVLRLLADGEFHSGQALGRALGVTRAAVWKHMQGVRELGLDLQRVPGRGYRLRRPLELLDAERIRAHLRGDDPGELQVHGVVDSTSEVLRRRERAGAPAGTVCLAEWQRAGRGRRGRVWVSPFGCNLYLSMLWRFTAGPSALNGLSLAVGVMLARALARLGAAGVGLKWPNDVVHDGRKLAGVLVDLSGEAAGPAAAVIGVGVNVAMPRDAAAGIDQPWTDLERVTGGPVSRNRLAGEVIDALLTGLADYDRAGLAPFIEEWRRWDALSGRAVRLAMPRESVSGRALGVDGDGALLVSVGGDTRRFASGEVSLRSAP